MIGQIVLSRVFNQCGIGWCCFEFGTYALRWLGTSNGLFLLHLVPLPWGALHVALALYWFGSSIQQFIKQVWSLLVMLGWVGHHWLWLFFVSVGLGWAVLL